jgi:3-isopropylmalate/(R)-2-methylmalate dehydratase small subunit
MSDLYEVVRGRVWKLGDSIDTSQLAGGMATAASDEARQALRKSCLAGVRPEFSSEARPGDIVVAGSNFGCGSHRQTAVEALQLCGIRAVLAESVARIHMRNSIALGLVTMAVPGISGLVEDGDELELDYGALSVRNARSGRSLPIKKLPGMVEQMYALGGISALMAKKLAEEGIVPPVPQAKAEAAGT